MTALEKEHNQQGCKITLGTDFFVSGVSRKSVFHFSLSPNSGFFGLFFTFYNFCGWLLEIWVKKGTWKYSTHLNFQNYITICLVHFPGAGERSREK